MKRVLLSAAWALAAALPLAAAGGRAVVSFDHPDRFTDIKDADPPTPHGEQAILERIRRYVTRVADETLPPGYHMAITFTDITLAGEFEPWRGPGWDDTRVVKPSLPPDFKFDYRVTNPSGKVIRQGTAHIHNSFFNLELESDTDDPLRFEKSELGDWLRRNLSRLPA